VVIVVHIQFGSPRSVKPFPFRLGTKIKTPFAIDALLEVAWSVKSPWYGSMVASHLTLVVSAPLVFFATQTYAGIYKYPYHNEIKSWHVLRIDAREAELEVVAALVASLGIMLAEGARTIVIKAIAVTRALNVDNQGTMRIDALTDRCNGTSSKLSYIFIRTAAFKKGLIRFLNK
jgi:hypothetical protein